MLLLLSAEHPAPVWLTKFGADTGCNLRPLCQWGDAMLPISREEPVMSLGGHSNFSSAISRLHQAMHGQPSMNWVLTGLQ
jgi:hypothetical protein